MTNKTITPLRCPFCGCEPKATRTSGDERDGYALRISYVCAGCGCSRGAVGESGKGWYADNSTVDLRALAAWNTRAALADPVPPADQEECAHDFRMFMSECAKCGEPYTTEPVPPAGVDLVECDRCPRSHGCVGVCLRIESR